MPPPDHPKSNASQRTRRLLITLLLLGLLIIVSVKRIHKGPDPVADLAPARAATGHASHETPVASSEASPRNERTKDTKPGKVLLPGDLLKKMPRLYRPGSSIEDQADHLTGLGLSKPRALEFLTRSAQIHQALKEQFAAINQERFSKVGDSIHLRSLTPAAISASIGSINASEGDLTDGTSVELLKVLEIQLNRDFSSDTTVTLAPGIPVLGVGFSAPGLGIQIATIDRDGACMTTLPGTLQAVPDRLRFLVTAEVEKW
ncbi:MAG: hypothetical protein JWO82_668 [Akkermansiaceae bacterium]|nr:hypothetical protein [Akkermansiaceae bacterium]